MALFGNKNEELEIFIVQKLKNSEVYELMTKHIKETFQAEGNEWMSQSQSYYDERIRQVNMEEDLFEIKWSTYHVVPGQERYEDIHARHAVSYTNSGFVPLHGYKGEGFEIPIATVMTKWGELIREYMINEFPQLNFKEFKTGKAVTFTYYVPEIILKDWF